MSGSLPKEVVRGLLEGVVDPDTVGDGEVKCRGGRCRVAPLRHHASIPRRLVEHYFNLACFYRARGDLYMAGKALGRAMHYLHDGAVKTRKRLVFNVHDDVEKEMERLADRLPDVCIGVAARRSNKAVEALCYAYLESRRLVERFMSEPLLPQEEALRVLWRGRAKRWGLVAAGFGAGVAGLAAGLPLALSGFLAAAAFSMWRPGEYAAAMRGGVACVKPRGYVPALTCQASPRLVSSGVSSPTRRGTPPPRRRAVGRA